MHNMSEPKKIIHIDMDCFYAAVEMRDNPSLLRKPVAVGGSPDQRGVLTTCNYEARRFGLHSAMSTHRALQLCPAVILLPVAMDKYREASALIHHILQDYTDIIEPLSLDEAYLDVSASKAHQGSATLLAQEIRARIFTTLKLTASAGIAANKFLAKVASDWRKPNGQFSIPPASVAAFITTLPVKKIPGVGRVTAKKLHDSGYATCGDLQALSQLLLHQQFGKFGHSLYDYCRGIDKRLVQASRTRKSVSVEHTFLEDIPLNADCVSHVTSLHLQLVKRLEKHADRVIHKQFIKIKFYDFTQMTKECVVPTLSCDSFVSLLTDALQGTDKAIRLLGVGVRFNEPLIDDPLQQALF
jgi:DNA polymerase IV